LAAVFVNLANQLFVRLDARHIRMLCSIWSRNITQVDIDRL
jgi:hypothetical protein